MAPAAHKKKQDLVPAVERTLEIIEHLVRHPQGMTLSEIAQALKFPKNSVFRILNTLLAYGYINRDGDTMHFTLSRKFLSLAYASSHERNLLENSLDIMRELRDQALETVVISIVNQQEGIVLEQVQGLHPFRFVCDPGTRQAVNASASVKAILAFTPERELQLFLRDMPFTRYNERTITNREEYERELELAREQGYAFDRAEALHGVHCVASPILNQHGIAIAALTITGPADRMPENSLDRFGAMVREHAARISQRFGYGLVKLAAG